MGYSVGYDSTRGRDIGYGVPSVCEHPGCTEEIDRGMAHACGQGFPEDGCGLYFCGKHLYPAKCERCSDDEEPFEPKPDTKEWIAWKLTDENWQQWRDENPDEVERLMSANADATVRQHNQGEIQMVITEAQRFEMLEAAKPLIQWMNNNCHPHCTASVDQNSVILVEGVATNHTDEFLRD